MPGRLNEYLAVVRRRQSAFGVAGADFPGGVPAHDRASGLDAVCADVLHVPSDDERVGAVGDEYFRQIVGGRVRRDD